MTTIPTPKRGSQTIDELIDWILDDENGVAHCCGQRGTGVYAKTELKEHIEAYCTERERLAELRGRIEQNEQCFLTYDVNLTIDEAVLIDLRDAIGRELQAELKRLEDDHNK